MKMSRQLALLFLVFGLLFLAACDGPPRPAGPQYGPRPTPPQVQVYVFAVHPLFNPTKLFQAYQPLVDYVNNHLEGSRLVLQASRDYAAFEEKYQKRQPDFLLPNPWQTLQAMKTGYHVLAVAGDSSDFRGIFLVRKDSGLTRLSDLKGKTVSYPASTAVAACVMLQSLLHQNGVDPIRDVTSQYVGSQESSIMAAYLGKSAAGGTWPPPWRAFQHDHPAEASALRVAWETEPLINNSVMARDDVPASLRDRFQSLLVGLKTTPSGQAVLDGMETALFTRADDLTYEPLRSYVSQFETEVRKIQ